ncbi:MAG: hypothetical protein LBO66_15525 [Deltaproteobacteria bacterium]|jgi:hypothetical protein|nr:hypothetical protein [Deltaproteobacteria bacterium]
MADIEAGLIAHFGKREKLYLNFEDQVDIKANKSYILAQIDDIEYYYDQLVYKIAKKRKIS